jgi:predicted ATPase
VLTGAPGVGKTAILRLLEQAGYPVVEEAATDVIALEHALGCQEPWLLPGFADVIVTLQRRRTYRELGFELIDVPAGPLPERAALVCAAVGLPAPELRRVDAAPAP